MPKYAVVFCQKVLFYMGKKGFRILLRISIPSDDILLFVVSK